MRKTYCLLAVVCLIIAMGAFGCSKPQEDKDVLFQTSTFDALLKGVYDGNMTFKDLKKYGDFGIGTFNGLDGEMVEVAGQFYQIKADGIAYPVDDLMRTPFSVVTFFEVNTSFLSGNISDYKYLGQYLDSLLPTENIFYAVKIEGVFDYIRTRSVYKQIKPYPPLTEAVKGQSTFELRDVTGTIIGFRCPFYAEGINVPGYHFHFITTDRKAGGHLLECQMHDARIEIDYTSELHMVLPENEDFYNVGSAEEGETEAE